MGHQYYKILCLHGEKDIYVDKNYGDNGRLIYLRPNAFEYIESDSTKAKNKKGKKTLRENINFDEYSVCGHSFYTQILERSLDTDYVANLCKKLKINDIHPTKQKNSDGTFLGYSDAFINVKLTKKSRKRLYSDDGFYCNGRQYVRYKRSASSAKTGNCLFIYQPLKEAMDLWNSCGLEIPTNSSDLTSWEAYTALTLSGIQGTFQLPRKSILIVRDLKSRFCTPGIAVTKSIVKSEDTGKDEEILSAQYSDSVDIENKIWDGEALIDESVFSELESVGFADSHMLLLRNRFFKSCGFKTKLQLWFSDNGITNVKSLNGYTSAKHIEDIKIVITESSLKYLTFYEKNHPYPEWDETMDTQDNSEAYIAYLGLALQSWFEGLGNSHNLTFGIVKSDKPSRFFEGKMVHTNYQLLNTLGLNKEETRLLLDDTLNYIEKAKNVPAFFRFFLKNGLTFSLDSDNAIKTKEYLEDKNIEASDSQQSNIFELYNYQKKAVQQLLNFSDDAFCTPICKYVNSKLMEEAKKQISKGRFLIPGTYAILFGNPIELLCSIINKSYSLPTQPNTISLNGVTYPVLKDNEIYCTMFDDGEQLCCARSPHITMGNLFLGVNNYLKNEHGKSIIDRYFDLSDQIVCVNSINHNLLQKLNGADFDSDTMLITNQTILVEAVTRQYSMFPVPINKINPMVDKTQISHWESLIKIDNLLSSNIVGKIVNCSQLLNSILWSLYPNICRIDLQKYLYFEYCKNLIENAIDTYLQKYEYILPEMLPQQTELLIDLLVSFFDEDEQFIYILYFRTCFNEFVHKKLEELNNKYKLLFLRNEILENSHDKWNAEANNFRNSIISYLFSKLYDPCYLEHFYYVNSGTGLYEDICILEVLSNLEIDKAKRIYIENTTTVFNKIDESSKWLRLQKINDKFVLTQIPEYLSNLKKKNKPSLSKKDHTRITGVNFDTGPEAIHLSTLQYIYEIATNNIPRAEDKATIQLTNLFTPISGRRENVDDFNRIKIIAAYYYAKIRTCHTISSNGKSTPDYGKCAYYVEECFKEIKKKILNNKKYDPSFMIFSLLLEIDKHPVNSKTNTLTINSIIEQINSWGEKQRNNFAHTKDLLELISVIEEENKKRKKQKKTVTTESYSNLLIAALCNIIFENEEIQKALIPPSSKPIKNIYFNDNGKYTIYGHGCNID